MCPPGFFASGGMGNRDALDAMVTAQTLRGSGEIR